MRQILIILDRFHWRQFTPVFALVMGFASCAICGGDKDLQGNNVCAPFGYVSAVGFPNGPVTVSWTPAEAGYVDDYIVYITSDHGEVGSLYDIDPSQTSAVIPLDQGIVAQTMNDPIPTFSIVGNGALSLGRGFGDCEFDQNITIKKPGEKKPALHPTFTSTPVPVPPKPQPPQPVQPAQPPTATKAPVLAQPVALPTNTPIPLHLVPIHVATCPPGYQGKPPNCLEIIK